MSLKNIQFAAIQTLKWVESGKNLTESMEQIEKKHTFENESDRGQWFDICYGSLRFLATLQFFLKNLVKNKIKSKDIELLLIVSIYQLHYTKNAQYAVVDEAVSLSKRWNGGRFKNFVNAVLREFLRKQEALSFLVCENLEAKYNLPSWWIKRLQSDYPNDWKFISESLLEHPPLTLRVNKRKVTINEYKKILEKQNIAFQLLDDDALVIKNPLSVAKLPHFYDGWVSVQDYGAQQLKKLLDIKSGDKILDACAAPGGKTGLILENFDCHLLALDISSSRLKKVEQNLKRLNLFAKLICSDAHDLDNWFDGSLFDIILADVPCTATGVLKRHPDIRWLRQEQDAQKIANEQSDLLNKLWSCLKSGGQFILSTCSIFREENEEQSRLLLNNNFDATLIREIKVLPNFQQDGFYYALFKKN